MVKFFCYLYTTGLITSVLMLHWINFLEESVNEDLLCSIRDIMLDTIKLKVIEDAKKPSLQNSCNALKKIIEKNIVYKQTEVISESSP